ncbi:MAG TPA: alpha/beta fold hydrolase [Longimicrobiaceae bacterium]
MEVVFERRAAGGVPLLLARPEGREGPLPAVLWLHGFGVDKETHRPELERLARAGFLAVGVDAAGHGERRLPDLDARIDAPREEALRTMLELASATADDVPGVLRALVRDGVADPARLAVAGISMGGYAVYRAVVVEPALRAAVALLGSPEWPRPDSPHLHVDALRRAALLSVTAERDENVPPDAARRLHRVLAAGHPDPGRQRYVELPGAEHLMSEEHWRAAMDETLAWLNLHAG